MTSVSGPQNPRGHHTLKTQALAPACPRCCSSPSFPGSAYGAMRGTPSSPANRCRRGRPVASLCHTPSRVESSAPAALPRRLGPAGVRTASGPAIPHPVAQKLSPTKPLSPYKRLCVQCPTPHPQESQVSRAGRTPWKADRDKLRPLLWAAGWAPQQVPQPQVLDVGSSPLLCTLAAQSMRCACRAHVPWGGSCRDRASSRPPVSERAGPWKGIAAQNSEASCSRRGGGSRKADKSSLRGI